MQKQKSIQIYMILMLLGFGTATLMYLDRFTQSELMAEPTVREVATTCTSTPVVAYVANLNFSLQANAGTRSSTPTFNTTTIGISNAINGDSAPALLQQTVFASGANLGSVLLTAQGPKSKIAGLGCQTETTSSLLIKAATNDNSTKVKLAIQAPSEANDVWNDARRLDNTTTGFTTHGASGTIHTSNIADTTDAEGLTNGEIVFGTTDPSKGGLEIQNLVTVFNSIVNNEIETLTFVFTAA